MVENLVDLEGHCLTWPHVGNLAEPAICVKGVRFIIIDRKGCLPLIVGCVISVILILFCGKLFKLVVGYPWYSGVSYILVHY